MAPTAAGVSLGDFAKALHVARKIRECIAPTAARF